MPHVYVDSVQGLDALVARLHEHPVYARRVLKNVVNKLAAEVLRNARHNLVPHRKTGGTIQAAQMRTNAAEISAVIGSFNLIGLFIEKGTRAHAIAARNARALMLPIASHAGSFSLATGSVFSREFGLGRGSKYRRTGSLKSGRGGAGAQVAFFKSVHHPGTKAAPWLMPALKQSAPMRAVLLHKAGEDITAFLGGHER